MINLNIGLQSDYKGKAIQGKRFSLILKFKSTLETEVQEFYIESLKISSAQMGGYFTKIPLENGRINVRLEPLSEKIITLDQIVTWNAGDLRLRIQVDRHHSFLLNSPFIENEEHNSTHEIITGFYLVSQEKLSQDRGNRISMGLSAIAAFTGIVALVAAMGGPSSKDLERSTNIVHYDLKALESSIEALGKKVDALEDKSEDLESDLENIYTALLMIEAKPSRP